MILGSKFTSQIVVLLISLILPLFGGSVLHAQQPTNWLVTPMWEGKAGLSLYGLDYESEIEPAAEDPLRLLANSQRWDDKWRILDQTQDREMIVLDLNEAKIDYSSTGGCLYLCSYLNTKGPVNLQFHFGHTLQHEQLWLNDQPVPLISSKYSLTSTNRINAPWVQKAAEGHLRLQPGHHRLLLKLSGVPRAGSKIRFQWNFAGPKGKDPEGLSWVHMPAVKNAEKRKFVASLETLFYGTGASTILHAGDSATFNVKIRPYVRRVNSAVPNPLPTIEKFTTTVVVRLQDYSGRELKVERFSNHDLADPISLDFGKISDFGFYVVRIHLEDEDGKPFFRFPSEGFTVTGNNNTAWDRRKAKKLAGSYNHLNSFRWFPQGGVQISSVAFHWLDGAAIFRNVGGLSKVERSLYDRALAKGVQLTADLPPSRLPQIAKTVVAPFEGVAQEFKGPDKIDQTMPPSRLPPEEFVAQSRYNYDEIKKLTIASRFTPASFVKPLQKDEKGVCWAEQAFKTGLGEIADFWNIHGYPVAPPSLEGNLESSPDEGWLGLHTLCEKYKVPAKPLWWGETGANANLAQDAWRWQADTVAKLAAWVNSRKDVEVLGYFAPWFRNWDDLNPVELGHRPGEAAMATASRLIDGLPYKGKVDLGENVEAAKFGETMILWSTNGTREITIPTLPDEDHLLVDVVGRVAPLDKGKKTVTVTESPIYLLSRKEHTSLMQ